MPTIHQFEDLDIWQNARAMVKDIYLNIDHIKDFGFRDQIQRAAVSVMNNIAEGFEQRSPAVFRRYLGYALASCAETRSMLYLANDLKYIKPETSDKLIEQTRILSKKIGKLATYLKTQQTKKTK